VTWAEAYLRAKWHLDPSSRFVAIDMGRKLGESGDLQFAPLFWVGDWYQSNTMWPESPY